LFLPLRISSVCVPLLVGGGGDSGLWCREANCAAAAFGIAVGGRQIHPGVFQFADQVFDLRPVGAKRLRLRTICQSPWAFLANSTDEFFDAESSFTDVSLS
jgi:hypothetical protein